MGTFQGGWNIIYINLNVYRERPPARCLLGIVYMVIMQIVIKDILGHASF